LRPWVAWLVLLLSLVLLTPIMWTSAFQYPVALALLLLAAFSVSLRASER
jgi:hypothetical protein